MRVELGDICRDALEEVESGQPLSVAVSRACVDRYGTEGAEVASAIMRAVGEFARRRGQTLEEGARAMARGNGVLDLEAVHESAKVVSSGQIRSGHSLSRGRGPHGSGSACTPEGDPLPEWARPSAGSQLWQRSGESRTVVSLPGGVQLPIWMFLLIAVLATALVTAAAVLLG